MLRIPAVTDKRHPLLHHTGSVQLHQIIGTIHSHIQTLFIHYHVLSHISQLRIVLLLEDVAYGCGIPVGGIKHDTRIVLLLRALIQEISTHLWQTHRRAAVVQHIILVATRNERGT